MKVKATEERFDTTLGTVPFRGVVDRVDVEAEGLVVTDYKSGRAPSARYAPDRLHQVLLYAAAVQSHTGEDAGAGASVLLGAARCGHCGDRISPVRGGRKADGHLEWAFTRPAIPMPLKRVLASCAITARFLGTALKDKTR